MNKNIKGFLMIESLLAVVISFLAVSIFSLIFIEGQKINHQKEKELDHALATHIMKKNDLREIKIHDDIYQK